MWLLYLLQKNQDFNEVRSEVMLLAVRFSPNRCTSSSSSESKQWYSSPFILRTKVSYSSMSPIGLLPPSSSSRSSSLSDPDSREQLLLWCWEIETVELGLGLAAMNQASRRQSSADSLSLGFFLSILATSPLRAGEYWSKQGGNSTSLFWMLLMVWLWQIDSKGVFPETSLQMRTPVDQTSTFSLYPPPMNISGARQKRVPVMVSMSLRMPLRRCLPQMPKSIILTFLSWGSQRMFSGLMSRWVTDRWCKQHRVYNNWRAISRSSSSPAMAVRARLPPSKNYITSQQRCFFRSRQRASYLITQRCERCFISKKFSRSWGRCSSQKVKALAAYSVPLFFLRQRCTTPLEPSPTFLRRSYFSAKSSAWSALVRRVVSSTSRLSPSGESVSEMLCMLSLRVTMALFWLMRLKSLRDSLIRLIFLSLGDNSSWYSGSQAVFCMILLLQSHPLLIRIPGNQQPTFFIFPPRLTSLVHIIQTMYITRRKRTVYDETGALYKIDVLKTMRRKDACESFVDDDGPDGTKQLLMMNGGDHAAKKWGGLAGWLGLVVVGIGVLGGGAGMGGGGVVGEGAKMAAMQTPQLPLSMATPHPTTASELVRQLESLHANSRCEVHPNNTATCFFNFNPPSS